MEEVGRGGMATVYRAKQISMNRIVAIKVLPRNLLHDPGFFERFEREVDVIAHLEHPHILPIYDYGKDQEFNVPYIVMRYLAGGSLEHLIRRGIIPLSDIEKPLRQIAQALDYAHQQGIIHRDLKPGNIMLDEADNAYLSDFGIARVLGSELTGSMIIGTPSYMSPEQANGMSIDGRSDIYALGVVLFELITGRLPYQAETPMAVLLKHINEPMPPIQEFRTDVNDVLQEVVVKSTAKDPNNRYSSAMEMAEAYSAALRGETAAFDKSTKRGEATKGPDGFATVVDTPAPGVIPDTRTVGTDPVGVPAPLSDTGNIASVFATGQIARGGSRFWMWLILLVVVIGVGAVGAVALSGGGDNPPPVNPNAIPTPFFRADGIEQDLYSISIPADWIPPQGFFDNSDTNRLVNVWRPSDLSASVGLELLELRDISNEEGFRDAIQDYERTYLTPQGTSAYIDEASSPDGTVRRSFRLVGASNPDFPPGQLDIFYRSYPPYLVALQLYSADDTGNTLVRTFQSILDSLRVEGAQSHLQLETTIGAP
jgi:serine/threonine-protein kinase